MGKLLHFAVAIVALGTVASLQIPLCHKVDKPSKTLESEPSAAATATSWPPTRLATTTNVILRIYGSTNCNGTTYSDLYEVPPGTCWVLPGQGAELLYHSCGQVLAYTDYECAQNPTLLPVNTCYAVNNLYSIQVVGC